MMILTHLNYLAVAVCSIIYFGLGAIWFSPMLFSKPWMAGHGIVLPDDATAKEQMRKEMPKMMGMTFVLCVLSTIVLAYLLVRTGASDWMGGAKIGLVTAFFPFMTMGLSHMYTRKSFKLTMIDAGYHIVSLIIVGIILSVWK